MYLALRVHLSITRFTTSLSREWCASRATSCVDALLRAALASSITLSFAPIIHHHLLTSLCYLLNTCSAVVLTPPSPGLPSYFTSIEPRSRPSPSPPSLLHLHRPYLRRHRHHCRCCLALIIRKYLHRITTTPPDAVISQHIHVVYRPYGC